MSKITRLTIITQQGTKSYFVGREYNGLKLHKIVDNTVETQNEFVPLFYGITQDGQYVFEVINAPVEIEYSLDT